MVNSEIVEVMAKTIQVRLDDRTQAKLDQIVTEKNSDTTRRYSWRTITPSNVVRDLINDYQLTPVKPKKAKR